MKKISVGSLVLSLIFGVMSGQAAISVSPASATQYPELIGWSCFRPGTYPVDPLIAHEPWNVPIVSTDYDRTQPWNTATHRKYKIRDIDGYYGSFNNWNGGETHEFLYSGQAVWGVTDILTYGEGLHQFTLNSIVEWDPNITLVVNVGEETNGNWFGFSVSPFLDYTQSLTVCEGEGNGAYASGGYGSTTLLIPDTLSDALNRATAVTTGTLNYSARGLSATTVPESTAPISLGEYTQSTLYFNITGLTPGHTKLSITYSRKNYTSGASLSPATATVTVDLGISGSNATAIYMIPVPTNEDERYTYSSAVTVP